MDPQPTNLRSNIMRRLWFATTLWFAAASEGNEGAESGRLSVGRMTLHDGEASRSNNYDWHQRTQYVQIRLNVVGILLQLAYTGMLSPPGCIQAPLEDKTSMKNMIAISVYTVFNELVIYCCIALLTMLITLNPADCPALLSSAINKLILACLAFTTFACMSASWVNSISRQINQTMLVVGCSMLVSVFIGLPLMQMRIRQCISSTPEQVAQQAESSDSDVENPPV